MKKILLFLSVLFVYTAYANTETINWYVDGNSYATNTCQTGGDIILPTAPTKYGYTFQGWQGYTQVEYLDEPDKQQKINTGVHTTTDNVRVQALVALHSLPDRYNNNWNRSVFNTPSRMFSFIFFDQGTQKIRIQHGGQNFYTDDYSFYLDTPYDIDCQFTHKTYDCKINNTNFTGNNPYNFELPDDQIYIAGGANLRIWYYKIYLDNTLVRDFIPVLDESNTPCMFDKVEEKFYYNAGTGDFIAGPAINQ